MSYYQEGLYEVRFKSQGFSESKEKKTPFFFLTFDPVNLILGDDIHPVDARYECKVDLWLTEKTVERTVENLRTIGWEGNSFRDLEPGGFSFEGVVGHLRCSHEQNGEKVYDKWDFPATGGVKVEHVSGMAKKLDALFGKALKASKPAAKAVEKPVPVTVPEDAGSVEDADEIPF